MLAAKHSISIDDPMSGNWWLNLVGLIHGPANHSGRAFCAECFCNCAIGSDSTNGNQSGNLVYLFEKRQICFTGWLNFFKAAGWGTGFLCHVGKMRFHFCFGAGLICGVRELLESRTGNVYNHFRSKRPFQDDTFLSALHNHPRYNKNQALQSVSFSYNFMRS